MSELFMCLKGYLYGNTYSGTKKMLQKSNKTARKEGQKIGIKIGQREGIKISQIKIAKNMLNKNVAIEEVAQTTELSIEEIRKIANLMK